MHYMSPTPPTLQSWQIWADGPTPPVDKCWHIPPRSFYHQQWSARERRHKLLHWWLIEHVSESLDKKEWKKTSRYILKGAEDLQAGPIHKLQFVHPLIYYWVDLSWISVTQSNRENWAQTIFWSKHFSFQMGFQGFSWSLLSNIMIKTLFSNVMKLLLVFGADKYGWKLSSASYKLRSNSLFIWLLMYIFPKMFYLPIRGFIM